MKMTRRSLFLTLLALAAALENLIYPPTYSIDQHNVVHL